MNKLSSGQDVNDLNAIGSIILSLQDLPRDYRLAREITNDAAMVIMYLLESGNDVFLATNPKN